MPVDALGREVLTPRPPVRVVSLVPSETESVVDLVGIERLAGRTEYCIEPAGAIERVPVVGGTKSIDVDRVMALEPDLVLANKEENARRLVEALIEAGLTVHVSFPRTVAEAIAYLESLAALLHVDPSVEPIARAREALDRALATGARVEAPVRVFVPIWRDPWMTFDGRAFASDVLALAGAENVFADRPRRYPLAADVGDAAPLASDRLGDRDTRYPRVTPDEIAARAPELALLPDEPYRFEPKDRDELVALGIPRVDFIDGKELFWYGTRVGCALDQVAKRVASRASP
jgi:ABC-type Fe3+-hydroxamate transport system substrate-binding protein